jgi:hypothetical protein
MSRNVSLKDVSCIGEYHILEGSSEKVSNEMSTMVKMEWVAKSDMNILVNTDGTVCYTIVMFRPTPKCYYCHEYNNVEHNCRS